MLDNAIVNAVTLKPYQGRNAELLAGFMLVHGFKSNRFATMKQWNSLGRVIIAGNRSCMISWFDTSENQGNRKTFTYKSYRVFNIEQTREYTIEEKLRHEARINQGLNIGITL
jgi:antirestriction protein ArdC